MKKNILILGSGLAVRDTVLVVKDFFPDLTPIQVSYGKRTDLSLDFIRVEKGREIQVLGNRFKDNIAAVVNRFDSYIPLHSKLVNYFGVYGPSWESARVFRYKTKLSELMKDKELQIYRPKSVTMIVDKVVESIDGYDYPFVIKPSVGAKSRGVFIVKSKSDVLKAVNRIREHFKQDSISRLNPGDEVLVEEYIDGKQIAPVSYVDKKGKLHIIAGVDVLRGPDVGQNHIQNVYRTTPSKMTKAQEEKVFKVLQLLVDKTKLTSTFLDPELYWVGDKLYVIEINVRLGGFRSILLEQAYGINLDELVVRLAMGEDLDIDYRKRESCTAVEVWDDKTGKVNLIKMPKGFDYVGFTMKHSKGDMYVAPPKGNVPLAYFYITDKSDSLDLAQKIVLKAQVKID